MCGVSIEDREHLLSAKAGTCFNYETFSRKDIEYYQNQERAAIGQLISDKVKTPTVIGPAHTQPSRLSCTSSYDSHIALVSDSVPTTVDAGPCGDPGDSDTGALPGSA